MSCHQGGKIISSHKLISNQTGNNSPESDDVINQWLQLSVSCEDCVEEVKRSELAGSGWRDLKNNSKSIGWCSEASRNIAVEKKLKYPFKTTTISSQPGSSCWVFYFVAVNQFFSRFFLCHYKKPPVDFNTKPHCFSLSTFYLSIKTGLTCLIKPCLMSVIKACSAIWMKDQSRIWSMRWIAQLFYIENNYFFINVWVSGNEPNWKPRLSSSSSPIL